MNAQNDDLNLIDLIGRGFEWTRTLVLRIATFLLQNLLFTILFSAIGLGAGYMKYRNGTRLYSAEMVTSSNFLQNDFCADMLLQLQSHIKDQSPELLAEALQINVDEANKIYQIEFSNFSETFQKLYEDRDTVVMGVPFRIDVLVSDNAVLPKLESGLIGYFDRNPYVVLQRQLQQQRSEAILRKIQSDLIRLDSLKNQASQGLYPRGMQNGFVFGQPIDPLNIYKEAMRLYREELSLAAEMKIHSSNLRIFSHFEPRSKPVRPRLYFDLFLGLMAGGILGFLVSLIRQWRRG